MKLMKNITSARMVIFTSILLTLFYNIAFFKNITAVYTVSSGNILFLASIAVVLTCLLIFVLTLLCWKYTTRPFLILILTISSLTAYFMDSYNVIIDDEMIQNVIQTDMNESLDLFSVKLLVYLLVLGILPAVYVYKVNITHGSLKTELLKKLTLTGISLAMIAVMLFSFSRFYTSFFREHKPLREYANPPAWVYAAAKTVKSTFIENTTTVTPIGIDAKIPATDIDRELIILVVGEAVRADRLSLNGYFRETTPLLAKEDVISFSKMFSCGTSTAVSVPCMFSIYGRDNFSRKKGNATENLLDVVQYAGVHVLWRENNSSSKGAALRVPYEDFRKPDTNPVCENGECRDEGMLVGLQDYIDSKKTGDIFIVLHQMGNHGPAYYKRYPAAFEKYTPVCKTNQLETCTAEEIGNAYDNAILYTDFFLSKTIDLLKQNTAQFETAMIYISDHGESLGETGIYLHGLPYYMAPDEQKHIGAMMWFGDSFKIDKTALRAKSGNAFSQDNLFHTLLGLMEIETEVYDRDLDIVNYDR